MEKRKNQREKFLKKLNDYQNRKTDLDVTIFEEAKVDAVSDVEVSEPKKKVDKVKTASKKNVKKPAKKKGK